MVVSELGRCRKRAGLPVPEESVSLSCRRRVEGAGRGHGPLAPRRGVSRAPDVEGLR